MNTITTNQSTTLSYSEIKKINLSLYSFFEYIKMPPICTSAIIVKNYLKHIIINNINKINFKSLKDSIKLLKLDWKTELSMLRKYLKSWIDSHLEDFKTNFSNIVLIPLKINTLNLLHIFQIAYISNECKTPSSFDPYSFFIKLEENKLFDRKLIRSYLFEQCNIFEKLDGTIF